MGHVHTKSNSYALTRVTDQIIWMSLSGVCLECRLRIQPLIFYLSFLFTKKKEMPPKTWPEKSDVIVNSLKYFEALTLIVRIKRQENQLSLFMTLEA